MLIFLKNNLRNTIKNIEIGFLDGMVDWEKNNANGYKKYSFYIFEIIQICAVYY